LKEIMSLRTARFSFIFTSSLVRKISSLQTVAGGRWSTVERPLLLF
jgi:hypothetical protein